MFPLCAACKNSVAWGDAPRAVELCVGCQIKRGECKSKQLREHAGGEASILLKGLGCGWQRTGSPNSWYGGSWSLQLKGLWV